jgi:hypothetical protein
MNYSTKIDRHGGGELVGFVISSPPFRIPKIPVSFW